MEDVGRPVPVHASGAGVVKDCVMCGLPYAWHDRDPNNWLTCPTRDDLVRIEGELEGQLALITTALKAANMGRG